MLIDHVVVAVPDLATATGELEARFGVTPEPGGRHPAHGTHNALVGLAGGQYVEVLATDPEAVPTGSARGNAIAAVRTPRLWEVVLAHPPAVPEATRAVASFGPPRPGERRNPDGTAVRWTLQPWADRAGDQLPDLITWHTARPGDGLQPQGRLLGVELQGPPGLTEALAAMYPETAMYPEAVEGTLPLRLGGRPQLRVETPGGTWTVDR